MLSYLKAQTILEMVVHPEMAEVSDSQEALKETNYEGVTGTVSFDENGDWVRDYLTLTVKDGKYVLYAE